MFGSRWEHSPFDFNTYHTRRAQHPLSRYRSPPPSRYPLPSPPSFHKPHPRAPISLHPKPLRLPKHTRFSRPSTESLSDVSTSDWGDAYTLDTDTHTDTHRPFAPRRPSSHSHRAAPDLETLSIAAPRRTAYELRADDLLILPPLAHVRVALRSPGGRSEHMRVAVPRDMGFEDLTKQVVRCYFGRGKMYTARVEQRGRMQEPSREATLGELAHRGEVYREGRMEMGVEIVVGEGRGEGWGVRGGFGGRGPGGGVDEVETMRKREVSRTRYKRI